MPVLKAQDRERFPDLFDQMFRGRADVFHRRLGWPVTVKDGRETDWYDRECEPVYVLDLDDTGRLLGSLRLLPTTGETMLRREFTDFFDEPVDVADPLMWECTKFCVHAPGALGTGSSIRLLIDLARLSLDCGISRIIGLYELQMERVYARLGWEPTRFATCRPHLGRLGVGIWSVDERVLERLCNRLTHCTTNTPAQSSIAS